MRLKTKIFKWFLYSTAILSLCLLMLQSDSLERASAAERGDISVPESVESEEQSEVLTHEKIIELTDEFMNILVQDINDTYQVLHYNSKEALLEAFETVTTREVAGIYVDFYYKEKDERLFILPTETPPWFNKNNDYNMVQLNNNKVKITQDNQSELYGDYRIEYEFSYDENWKITKITHI